MPPQPCCGIGAVTEKGLTHSTASRRPVNGKDILVLVCDIVEELLSAFARDNLCMRNLLQLFVKASGMAYWVEEKNEGYE